MIFAAESFAPVLQLMGRRRKHYTRNPSILGDSTCVESMQKSQKEPDSGAFVIITALQAHVHANKVNVVSSAFFIYKICLFSDVKEITVPYLVTAFKSNYF